MVTLMDKMSLMIVNIKQIENIINCLILYVILN